MSALLPTGVSADSPILWTASENIFAACAMFSLAFSYVTALTVPGVRVVTYSMARHLYMIACNIDAVRQRLALYSTALARARSTQTTSRTTTQVYITRTSHVGGLQKILYKVTDPNQEIQLYGEIMNAAVL